MKKEYLKSLEIIKERKIKTRKEYHKIAKEEKLLNVESIQYISGKSFCRLCSEILK